MEKIRPFWRIIIGLFLFTQVVYASSMMNMGRGNPLLFPFYGAALVTWIYLCIRVKYVDPVRALYELELEKKAALDAELKQQREEREAKRKAEEEQRRAEEEKLRAEREEFERTHGRLEFNIAGVTYKNPDGSSRQNYLRQCMNAGCTGTLDFEEYEYNGEPAVSCVWNGTKVLGNVPRKSLKSFLKIKDKISKMYLDIDTFDPDDDDDADDDDFDTPRRRRKEVYYAKVCIFYDKAPD